VAAVSGKKTLIWAVVLLAAAAFYYLYEIRGDKGRREAAQQKELLVHVTADEVTGMTIKRASETISAVKRDEHWHLTEPLSVPADDQKYREMVRYLTELRQLRVVEEQPSTLDPFGLNAPVLEVRVYMKEPAPPLVLRLGDKNPTGSGYYTQVEGRPAVYLTSTAAKDVLDASLFDLRDKTVLAFDPAAVQEVQLASDTASPVHLLRQDADHWQITAPVSAPADAKQVQALLRSIHDTKVQTFVAESAADLEPYGLQTPALRLALTMGQERSVKALLLGRVEPDRKGIYARPSDGSNIVLLPQQFWDNLPKTATALRDKTLLRYDRDHITRLELHSADEQIVITRTGPRQYQLEQPVSTAGDGDAIYSLLWDLKELKAKDVVAEAPEQLQPYGLEPSRLRVTLWEEAADKTQEARQHTLLIGSEAPENAGTYVRQGDRPTVYLVESAEAQRIVSKTALALRNKKLLAFETASIQKVQFQYPTSTLTVERHKDTWQLSAPDKQTIEKRWKIDDLLFTLSRLEYTKLLAERIEDGAPYGLEAPRVRISLWPKEGPPIGPLLIGKPADTEGTETRLVYAQLGSALYAVKADILEELPKTAADLTAEKW
jgi:hypothetical protein